MWPSKFLCRLRIIPIRNTYPKPTEKLAGPHNERRLLPKNYNQGKNGRKKKKRKTLLLNWMLKKRLQQVEGESWIS